MKKNFRDHMVRRGDVNVLVTLIGKGGKEKFFVTVWLRKVVIKEVLAALWLGGEMVNDV